MKLTKVISLMGLVFLLSACVDDKTIVEEIQDTPNLIGFEARNTSVSGIADGSEYEKVFNVNVFGPSTDDLGGSYTATVTVDPSSTAIEGTHFTIDDPTIEVTADGNLASTFSITMLTDGIVTPLDENPVLILNLTNASGEGVIASGAPLTVNMLYLCPSDLAGNYVVTITREDGAGPWVYNDVISQLGPGQYRGQSVGHWAPGSIGGTPGFPFTDVCNTLSLSEHNLLDLYGNLVGPGGDSYVDPVTGNLHIEYYITFSGAPLVYTADYVKQ